ncbi:helix-turn-helix domain-containing protein [Acidobacteriota bacterium]
MATLGQDLKKERELRGISLKEIADTTKINIRYLQALEEDQIELLPGSFFIKGILRSYSEYVGLEEHDVLNRFYQEEQRKQQVQEDEEEGQEDEKGNKKGLSRTVKSLLSFTVVVTVLVGILVVLYFIFQRGENPALSEQPKTTKIPQTKFEVPEAGQDKVITESRELNLSITFHDLTWIEVFADGDIVLEGNQEPGLEFQTRAERELVINCGNLGGFTYTINGRKGKPLGRLGAVLRDIRINLDNLDEFIEIEEKGS